MRLDLRKNILFILLKRCYFDFFLNDPFKTLKSSLKTKIKREVEEESRAHVDIFMTT
jgi:hypothetical protein